MGSAATDNSGNLAVGYSVSSLTTFPSIRYAGRLAGDPPGGLGQGEKTLVAGSGVQRSTGSRWGDYSMLAVDPADDCTFWYATEYYTAASQATSTVGWLTRIGSFRFDACAPPSRSRLQGVVTSCANGLPIGNVLVATSSGYAATTGTGGDYSIRLASGSYNLTASAPGYAIAAAADVAAPEAGAGFRDLCLTPVPDFVVDFFAVSGGNGNGRIEFNECDRITVGVQNSGGAPATGVSAVLSTSTPGVTVTQPHSAYPDMGGGAVAGNLRPFEVSTPPTFACGTSIHFNLNLTSAEGMAALAFTVPTCSERSTVVKGSITANDLQQNMRLLRDRGTTSFESPKLGCPGPFGMGPRSYDAYTFSNPAAAARVTFDLTSGCGLNIFGAAYLGTFDPTDVCDNYLADQGLSFAGTGTASFIVPGGQAFTIVVNEVNQGVGCVSYAAKISGLFEGIDGGGECVRPAEGAK
jgi:hypothetical protein